MRETATILELQDKTVVLQFHEQEACKNCGSMFCKANERTFVARNDKNLDLHVGDKVTVYLPPGKTIQASFLLLIVPLILFFLFFMTAERLFGIETELAKIGFGLAGLVVGFGITYFITKNNKKSSMPLIIDLLDS